MLLARSQRYLILDTVPTVLCRLSDMPLRNWSPCASGTFLRFGLGFDGDAQTQLQHIISFLLNM